jgi:hypothetical protein
LHIWLHTFMTKMTHRTNLSIVVKLVDLDTNHIYSHNHMVGMDKISSSETIPKTSMTSCTRNHFSSFRKMLYLHFINDVVMEDNTSNRHIDWCLRTWIMHHDKNANKILEIQVPKSSMQNFMCPFIVMMLTCQCSVNIFWRIHINKLFNLLCKPFLIPHKVQRWNLTNFPIHMFEECKITTHNKFVNIFKLCEERAW